MNGTRTRKRTLLAEHFQLAKKIRTRLAELHSDPQVFQEVERACERMIEIAPDVVSEFYELYGIDGVSKMPSHAGYERLIIIRLQQGRHEEAERLRQEYGGVWREARRYLLSWGLVSPAPVDGRGGIADSDAAGVQS